MESSMTLMNGLARPLTTAAGLIALLLVPAIAQGATVVVVYDCGAGQMTSKTIDGAPQPAPVTQTLRATMNGLVKTDVNTLRLIGTCSTTQHGTNQQGFHFSFDASGHTNLTITSDSGIATLSAPSETCTPGQAAPTGGTAVLFISSSDRVVLQNLTITGGRGLSISDSVVQSFGGVTVSGSRTNGIAVGGGRGSNLTLTGSDVVTDNCSNGLFVTESLVVSGADITNNRAIGVFAGPSTNVIINLGSVISGNGTAGAITNGGWLTLNGAEVSSNGAAPLGQDAVSGDFGGVVGRVNAVVQVTQSSIVRNNTGAGVRLNLNSTGIVGGGAIVEANSAGGLNLIEGSVARLDANLAGGIPLLRSNGGGSVGDLNCDAYSQAFGNASGVLSNKCVIQGGGK